jgi:hypothetical protein
VGFSAGPLTAGLSRLGRPSVLNAIASGGPSCPTISGAGGMAAGLAGGDGAMGTYVRSRIRPRQRKTSSPAVRRSSPGLPVRRPREGFEVLENRSLAE